MKEEIMLDLKLLHAFLSGAFIHCDNPNVQGVLEKAICDIDEIIEKVGK